MRYRVIGSDEVSGESMELVVEARSEDDARFKAGARGLSADRVELEGGPAPAESPAPPPRRDDDEHESGPREAPGPEAEVWVGGPSQWVNVKKFFGELVVAGALLALAIVIPRWAGADRAMWITIPLALLAPALHAMWTWITTRAVRYELTTERIREREGVFARHVEEVELHRVVDTKISQTFTQRLVGLGTITLLTNDATTPEFRLRSTPGHEALWNEIRTHVAAQRRQHRVREQVEYS